MKIGYARVSTDAQETHLQMDALKRAQCARVYEEKASRPKAERPELMKLLDNARQGRCRHCLEAGSPSPFAPPAHRHYGSAGGARRGVALPHGKHQHHDAERQVDLSHLLAALAEFERDILRQRVSAGLKAAHRRGRIRGRPKALDDADLKKARALLRSGDYTKVQVAEELEVSRHTLWRALSTGGTVVSTRSRSDSLK